LSLEGKNQLQETFTPRYIKSFLLSNNQWRFRFE